MKLAQYIIRKLYPHGAVRRVLSGYLRGWLFEVVPGMGLTYSLGLDHLNFRFLEERLGPGETVYDIGANCGQMSLFFAKRTAPGGRILAFEPAPENVARLRRNLALNGVTSVQVFEAAVAEDNQKRLFSFEEGQHSTGGLAESRAHVASDLQQKEVACLSLDEVVSQGNPLPDLIKIDVEGGGYGVIRGAQALLAKHRPAFFFEVHAANDDSPELEALRHLKQAYGYRWFDMQGCELHQLQPMWGTPVWCVAAKA